MRNSGVDLALIHNRRNFSSLSIRLGLLAEELGITADSPFEHRAAFNAVSSRARCWYDQINNDLKESPVLGKLQSEIRDWRMYNFPDTGAHEQYMGMVEELGELTHAMLKWRQGIRGMDEETMQAEAQDALGDMIIYAINFADMMGWDFEKVLATTWEQVVSKRDWRKAPDTGVVDAEFEEVASA